MQEQYVKSIREVFPEWDGRGDLAALTFENVPGWDSMNSVNLQVELETAFDISLVDRPMEKGETLASYLAYIQGLKEA